MAETARAYRPRLVMMGKPPLMGRVKTRLGRDIGPADAVSFYRQSVGRLLHRLGRDRRWDTFLAVNASLDAQFGCWPSTITRMSQGSGSLGDRMRWVFDRTPPGPVLIIGTDTPHIEPHHIADAFRALSAADAVFGPSDDGGYWGVGLARRRRAPHLFEGVRWSTEHALADSRASLPSDFRVDQLVSLTDVDTGEDYAAHIAEHGEMRRGPWGSV